MKRFITGRLGIFVFLSGLLAVGCAVEQASETTAGEEESQESSFIGAEPKLPQLAVPNAPMFRHSTKLSDQCASCGPLPDPWSMGPLPDPWSSSSGGNTSSSSSSGGNTSSTSSSSGGSSSTSSGGKP